VVVVDLDPERVAEVPHPALIGDVTDDDVLRKAGIMRATAVVAAINTDTGNVWVTLSARRCGLTLSSSPAPALRRQSPSSGEPARPGSWTRSGSAAGGSRQQRCSPAWWSSSTS
jgi:TrkA-N domain